MIEHLKERVRFAWFCIVHRRSRTAQRRWQGRHLHALVRHAYHTVPLWRTLLDERGLKPDDIKALEDLSKLPITSKSTFIGKMVEEYVDSTRLTRSYWYVTSGTSGTPFRFLMSEQAIQENYSDFGSLRFLWWLGEPLKRIFSVKLARIKIRGSSHDRYLFVPVEEYLRDPAKTLGRIQEFDPVVLAAYPSILLDMARLVSEHPELPRPHPRFVLSFGEMLFPSVRHFVREVLQSDVYDRYGLEEIGAVGVECKEHDGFHINTESVIIEITDDSYQTVAPGVEGKIVATDLLNTGMPFIRYDTGDRGKVSYEPCACGLHSPRIWVRGRYSAYLAFPERRIHHLEFDGAMDGFMNYIFQYQIAKRSNEHIVARIVPGPAFAEDVVPRIQEKLSALVGPTIRISVEQVSHLPITRRGKSRIVVDESSP